MNEVATKRKSLLSTGKIFGVIALMLMVVLLLSAFPSRQPKAPVATLRHTGSKDASTRTGSIRYSGTFWISNRLDQTFCIPVAKVEVRRNGQWTVVTNEYDVLRPIAPHATDRFSIPVPVFDEQTDAWRARLTVSTEMSGLGKLWHRTTANLLRWWQGQKPGRIIPAIQSDAVVFVAEDEITTEPISD